MTESIPKLSIAILTYNRREYLQEVLESLALQTFKDFCVKIFDNASSYDVHEFITMFPNLNISIHANDTNIGAAANFRKVITFHFNSPYTMMFHDDDTMHPNYLEKAIAFLDTYTDAVWVGSNITFIKNSTPEKMSSFKKEISSYPFLEISRQEIILKLLDGFSLGFCSVVYRTEALAHATSREAEFDKWLDRPLMIDLIGDATVGITKGEFINYRVHGGQDSQIVEPLKLNNVINLFKYYRQQMEGETTKAYCTLETNNAINTAHHVASTFPEFFSIINLFKKEGLFQIRCIGLKGIYYFLKFVVKFIRLRLK